MAKKKQIVQGEIDRFANHEILLNVNHLEKGNYKLKIVYKNKIIKSTQFTKD
jgi:hypothetical protein